MASPLSEPSSEDSSYLETLTKKNSFSLAEPEQHALDANLEKDKVKTTKDGHIVLIPQPSDRDDDPFNWSQSKKATALFVLSFTTFLANYSSSTGIPLLEPQADQWHLTPVIVQRSLAANVFCIGVGALFAIPLSTYFGMLPVLFFSQVAALGMAIWTASATSFNSYFAARVLDAIFGSVGEGCGLLWIQSIFFFHEHPRKINVWSGSIVASPYAGPFIASWILTGAQWPWAFWTLTIARALCLLVTIFFVDEPWYNRAVSEPRPVQMSRWWKLLGIEQWRNRSVAPTVMQYIVPTLTALTKIPILLIVIYYFLNHAWLVGVNTTITIWLTELYGFDNKDLGLYYLSPLVGGAVGWLLGHWMHDFIGKFYMRHHSGHMHPEARLWACYVACILLGVSELVLGFALQQHWHYMVICVFCAIQICGILIATVGASAYLVDAYPEKSGVVSGWLAFGRASGGFMATYIQLQWVAKSGAELALGIQAATAVASLAIVIFLQIFGMRVRRWQGDKAATC